ncbi:MAG: arylesterase [Alphaproteobacteria bacterium]|jgi:acyl-CoA thioesterase-1|nr:arylesterase [Alphaproteobacteria bacterium]
MIRLLRPVLVALVLTVAAPLLAAAAPARILMLGDSITAGYGLAPEDALPRQLQDRLRKDGIDATVLDAGVSGDTTAGGRSRLAWSLADKPTHVIVALGGNDLLRAIDPKDIRANLDAILAELKSRNIPTMLVGMMAPANLGRAYAADFDPIYPELAKKYGARLYPFLLDGVALDAKLNQQDGIHPNAQGVRVIVDRLAPQVEMLIRD